MASCLPQVRISIYEHENIGDEKEPRTKTMIVPIDENNTTKWGYEFEYYYDEPTFFDGFVMKGTGSRDFFRIPGCIGGLIHLLPERKNSFRHLLFSYTCLPTQTQSFIIDLNELLAMEIQITNMMPKQT